MTNFVGVPQAVSRQLSPDLFGKVVTELLSRKERYNLLLDDDQVRDFGEFHEVQNLPVDRVLTAIEQGIPQCDYHRVSIMGNHSATLEVVGLKQEAVRRGDMVRAGALISFSPINTIQPVVQSYVMRLACTNGMTANTVLAKFTGGHGEGDNIWQWFRQSARAAGQALGAIVSRYQDMISERVPAAQRASMLEDLLRQAGITGKEAEAVRAQAIQSPPRNTYDMLNLVSWASSHIVRSPERVQRAQNAVAVFTDASQHASVCPLCHTRRQN